VKKVTYVCDRCGKDLDPNEVVYVYVYVRGSANTSYKIADLCKECYEAAKDKIKGGLAEIFGEV